ncbi:DHA2 family efflux MFS transporter permease subunit [Dactylosporangium vinaceum]|uniref:DHA2 family efflux MFS transporter permease subunit n=1 Tax=Dactylosporangium vinaceum TaxID=53362 RepID=A0ABV5MJ53_9ACTN|nr:DHA2 family efflux MFS transporter permease subunit [Dactylosporangium vinaceum]UAB93667.1 DHA2 family efflux MFS transporter permease subunit [Dactylosporangium vinaceum]
MSGTERSGLEFSSATGRWVLTATILGSGIASIDATVVGIALPAIGRSFDTGLQVLQWVVTAYTLTLAGLLLLSGALGDRYGRRRMFTIGVVWFAAASVVCGIAPDGWTLVAARALQGVGAALLTPGSLAILQASFRAEDRSKAIGAWSGLGGVATAIGPFLGGWLVGLGESSWRLIFAINVPIAAAVVYLTWRHVPESRDEEASGRVDLLSGALVTAGLIGVTYGLIEGQAQGWASLPVLGALVAGAALIALFLWRQTRLEHPMLPLELFASAQFTSTNVVTFIIYGALGGALFLLPIQLQQVAGYTPLQAGVSLLPVTVVMLLLSARSGALAARIGPRLQMSVGPVVAGIGMALYSRVDAGGSYLTEVLPAVLTLGLGLSITVAPLTSTALSAAPETHAGMASAVNNDVARAAGLIAVAVLPAAAGITSAAYADPALLSAGFHRAVLICALLCVVAGLLAAVTIRNVKAVDVPDFSHCAVCEPPAATPAAVPAGASRPARES